jgi:hypothetical protein
MTTATPSTAHATIQPAFTDAERIALAGFLAGYRGLTREAYALDLRQFTTWCRARSLSLFAVRRAEIESFARELEVRGRDDPPHPGGPHRSDDGGGPGRGDPGVGVVVRAERGQHRVGPGNRGLQDLRVGGGEVGGDDPRGPPGEQLGGELGGVARHRGDVVPGVQGLGQQPVADAAGGGDDG